MSIEQQNAILQDALDRSWFYKVWAAIKHGLPDAPPRNIIGNAAPNKHISNSSTDISTSKTIDKSNGNSLLKNAAIIIALLTGGTTGGYLANEFINDGNNNTIVPFSPEIDPKYGDLIKYLDENGYNIPPNNGLIE